ncbi:hypothetical protein Hanom_Chr02g00105691 [Helianthus anomalus]
MAFDFYIIIFFHLKHRYDVFLCFRLCFAGIDCLIDCLRAVHESNWTLLHVNPLNWGYRTTTFKVGSSMGATNNDPDPQSS